VAMARANPIMVRRILFISQVFTCLLSEALPEAHDHLLI
jgi:hypothetical protein